jgi:TonB-dependent SusC/RagA subfamily outer membrane receptor
MPNEPLIVLDGLPWVILPKWSYKYFVNDWSNDIESYNLKDASAAAIYGSRAANGV